MRRNMMSLMWPMMVFVLTMERKGSQGCLQSERIGLLDINVYFQNYSSHIHPWDSESGSSECCHWTGVECDSVTGRVTALDIYEFWNQILHLYATSFYYTGKYKELRVNASLFLPFQELRSLSFRYMRITGCLENEGFDKLSTLAHFEYLDLRENTLNNSILSSLSTLSSLKHLDLFGCQLTTQLRGFEEISKLRNLEYLHLGYNDLGNNILPYLSNMSSLKYLELYDARLNGTINIQDLGGLKKLEGINLIANNVSLKGLTAFSNLKTLKIERTSLREPQEISRMTKLEEIWLSEFSMSEDSTLLQNLTSISSLKGIVFFSSDLHAEDSYRKKEEDINNMASATVPPLNGGWPIGFKKLEYLEIQDSTIQGDFLYVVGTTMTNLKNLTILNSNLQSTISPGLCNLKNLRILELIQNNLTGELPQCLSNLTSLQSIDISYNELQGNISESPLAKLFSLEYIDIAYNGFRIPLSLSPFFNHSRLRSFLAYGNQEIYGDHQWMKHDHDQPLFQLRELEMGLSSTPNDGSIGPFPKFLYYQRNLEQLHIKDTKMETDSFPWWLMDNNTNLEQLVLPNCSLSGSVQHLPHYISSRHENLFVFDITSNDIHGTIPSHICTTFPRLLWLYLRGNKLAGKVPEQLSNCSALEILSVSDNSLSGEIPRQIWNISRLIYLDLSRNRLSGSLPSTFISPWIYEVHLSRNRFTGALPSREDRGMSLSTRDYNLQVLDLSNNYFSGGIPDWIVGLPQLRYLLLKNNGFSGEFVKIICFEQFKIIDVSQNHLSGDLASAFTSTNSCLYGMLTIQPWLGLDFITKTQLYTFLGKPLELIRGVDFSSNNFTGEIPPQIGRDLTYIKFLNLSYNKLQGQIPSTFSNLHDIESLDLSHNSLSGRIPPQLAELTSLEVFDVGYNNLSGKCPKFTAQFGTFNESSYRGNPFLCCTFPVQTREPLVLLPTTSHDGDDDDDEEDDGLIDMEAFYASGGVTCVMTMLIIAGVLYINPRWRRIWFYYVKMVVIGSYYFVVDNLPLPPKYKMWELRV